MGPLSAKDTAGSSSSGASCVKIDAAASQTSEQSSYTSFLLIGNLQKERTIQSLESNVVLQEKLIVNYQRNQEALDKKIRKLEKTIAQLRAELDDARRSDDIVPVLELAEGLMGSISLMREQLPKLPPSPPPLPPLPLSTPKSVKSSPMRQAVIINDYGDNKERNVLPITLDSIQQGLNKLGSKVRELVWLSQPDFENPLVLLTTNPVKWANEQRKLVDQSILRLALCRRKLDEFKRRSDFKDIAVNEIIDAITAVCMDEDQDIVEDVRDEEANPDWIDLGAKSSSSTGSSAGADPMLQSVFLPQRVKRWKTSEEIVNYFERQFDYKQKQLERSLAYLEKILKEHLAKEKETAISRKFGQQDQQAQELLKRKIAAEEAAREQKAKNFALDEARRLLWDSLGETAKSTFAAEFNKARSAFNPLDHSFEELVGTKKFNDHFKRIFLERLRRREDYTRNFLPHAHLIEAKVVILS